MKARLVVAGVLVVCLMALVWFLIMPFGKSSDDVCVEAAEVVERFYSGLRDGGEEVSGDLIWAPALSARISAKIRQDKRKYGGVVSWKVLRSDAGVLRGDGVPVINHIQCTVVSMVEGSEGKSRVETIVLYGNAGELGIFSVRSVPVLE